jgi:hypothetical protein
LKIMVEPGARQASDVLIQRMRIGS